MAFLNAPRLHAEESTDAEAPASQVESAESSPSKATAPSAQPKRGKRPGEKETDGSQAPNRFEADTVIKSKYRVDGQPLEVDPD